MKHCLEADDFALQLEPQIFEEDLLCSVNTVLRVCVRSSGFSAAASMDVDAYDLSAFSRDLSRIYETLNGCARLEEPYGQHMYLSFDGDGRGHISVAGRLNGGGRIGNFHELSFQNEIDQTCLRTFCASLAAECDKYT